MQASMPPPLRILMFSDAFGDRTTTFIRNETRQFSRRHRLKYITLRNSSCDTSCDVEVIPWPARPIRDRLEWRLWQADLACNFRHRRFGKALQSAIERFDPQIIHCHFGYEALRLLQNVNVSTRGPMFVHFHGYDASETLRRTSYVRALRPYLELPNVRPIVVSEYMKAELQAAGLPMDRAKLLRYGIDLDLFRPPPAESPSRRHGTFVIAQVSSIISKKGHRETLQALALMLERNPALRKAVVYRIAGEGPDEEAVRSLGASLGLSENVDFLGPVTPAEVMTLLSEADVFSHHSVTDDRGHKEGIPNAIMEAMAMELPILASRHAGIPELVEHGVHGLLCEERDVETFSRQIEEIMSWGRRPANRLRIEQEYNMLKHNAQLERIYREALAET